MVHLDYKIQQIKLIFESSSGELKGMQLSQVILFVVFYTEYVSIKWTQTIGYFIYLS